MKLVIALFCCLTVSVIMASQEQQNPQPTALERDEWKAFKATHSKNYEGAEDEKRLGIYLMNKAKVEEHNKRHAEGLESYTQGLNQFSDLEHDEFVNRYTGYKAPKQ